MRARKIIIETLLKEATDEEKLVAQALNTAFSQVAKDIKANKAKLAPETQNEAVGVALVGGLLAAPAIMGIVGKGVKIVQNILAKGKGDEPIETNTIIEMGKKLHHIYLGTLEKALFFVKDEDKKKRLASIIFHAVIAGLLVASGKGFFKALQKHQSLTAFIEAMLSAIKAGELGVFATETFGALATALGTSAELADAAELLDAADELSEMSAMSLGAVEGGAGKTKDNLEENKMNKLKITKGRLRQILAEEVARHKRLNEEMGAKEEEAEAASFASQAKGAAATKGGSEQADAFYEGEELEESAHDYEGIIEGDFVNIIGGALTGAIGRVVELTMSTQGKPALVVRLTKDADMQVYGKSGDEVIVQPKFVEKDQGMYSMAAMEEDKHAGMTAAKFADMFDLNMQQDNDGQTIFYASSEMGPKLKELFRQANAAGYSMENNNDGSITIYTGEYSDKMEEEKTDKHDAEMKEKGFSDEQAENLHDELQKAMLKKEVRAMLEELMSDV